MHIRLALRTSFVRPVLLMLSIVITLAGILYGIGVSAHSTASTIAENRAPIANDASYTVHNSILIGRFPVSDPEGNVVYGSIISPPSNGTLDSSVYGALYPRYTPNAGFSGTDSLVYEGCDKYGACASATVTVNVVNQAPVSSPSSYTLHNAKYLGYFYRSDPDNDTLYSGISVQPAHGTIDTRNYGALYPYYTPTAGYKGPDSFVYIVCDKFNACAQGTVYINNDDANAGETSCNAYVGGPINVTNGNMYLQQTDYQLPGAGEAINLTRTYNSNSLRVGLFGRGGIDRLTRLQQVKGATTVADYQYQFNMASNLTQQVEQSGTHNYGYDVIDRLTSATHPNQTSESYAYDAVGNRTASHQSTSYSYQPFNKVVSIGSNSYSYDSNGNLTQKTDSGGTWTYTWDYENRLKQVTRPDIQTITYKYDALGR